MPRTLLFLTLALFGALTAAALWQHGYWGIFEPHLESLGGAQVFVDLLIALTLVLAWMWHDAKARGRSIWPWIVLTLLAGSFGPLLYLLRRKPGQEMPAVRPPSLRNSAAIDREGERSSE